MGQPYESVLVDTNDHVARVTLIGPGKGNAMGPAFWAELPELFGELDANPDVRAIVLTGTGRNFSYDLDLPAMGGTLAPVLADGAMAGPRSEFEIADNPPLMVRGVKDVLDQQRISQVSASLRYVAAWNAAFLPSKDLSEGIQATFAKRPPKFTGE